MLVEIFTHGGELVVEILTHRVELGHDCVDICCILYRNQAVVCVVNLGVRVGCDDGRRVGA